MRYVYLVTNETKGVEYAFSSRDKAVDYVERAIGAQAKEIVSPDRSVNGYDVTTRQVTSIHDTSWWIIRGKMDITLDVYGGLIIKSTVGTSLWFRKLSVQ